MKYHSSCPVESNSTKTDRDSSEMREECPHCSKSFKCLRKHLRTCKRKDVPRDSKQYREMDLQDELQERLRRANVNPRRPNISVKLSVDKIKKIMLKKLNDSWDGKRWKAFNSGSYYEILKVSILLIL